MAISTKDDILKLAQTILAENNSDEALKLIEDISDTFDDLGKGKGTNEFEDKYNTLKSDYDVLKANFDNLDSEWRTRYKERFFSGASDKDNEFMTPPDEDNGDEAPETFDELFTESEAN